MSDVTATASSIPPAEPIPNLLSRAIGVITSPGATFAHVVRTPKVAGMLFLVALVMGLAQGLPQLTERGRAAALEMQVQQMERFGVAVTDEMYQQMEQRSHSNLGAYSSIVGMFVAIPFGAVIMTVLLWVAFNTIMGGTASFKHVMSVVAHSQAVSALGAIISAPIMYARGVMSTSIANLGALLPMLDETSFLAKLLGGIDLFVIWWVVVLSIGLAALYRKKTSSIATGLFVVYGLILIVIAYSPQGKNESEKVIIGVLIIVVIGAVAYANLNFKRTTGIEVNIEKLAMRDLEAIVSASGKIRPKKSVNISADTMGKVVGLAVNEGDMVTAGQFLLQIDPRNLQTQVNRTGASLAAAQSQLAETRIAVENARTNLKQAQDNLERQRELIKSGLTPRETLDRAESDVKLRQSDLTSREQSVKTQETRIKQEEANVENAQYDLNKVRIVSPISGIVTRRNIEEGETVVVGTMNNAGTVLLAIADLSVIETEVEVDETDIPFIKLGQTAVVTIDALTDQKFTGKVTEVGNSAIQATGAAATTRATNFKVVVTLDGTVPDVRPGFTCTAVITTATRQKVLSVPIQATTVREMVVNADGSLVRVAPTPPGAPARRVTAPTELQPGQTRKEIEGAFVVTDGKAVFTPIKVGIAGEKFFEVLSGLKDGDEVITGPFTSVRSLKDGDAVKVTTTFANSTGK